jgi:hypothetical protein
METSANEGLCGPSLKKLRKDAAECALIRDLATDKAKREMFDRLANHLTVLADQVERGCSNEKTRRKRKAASVGSH